ncbi:hypothetical protein [Phenylobacterium sp.]|uniref:hypothetical protein n=1 Tax=Phenylobacterium sp. TaxID=1871053 RepID=UPI002736F2BC|nr:hypothetical protein [Phenylobacterium sp.]MDP3660498.1 hypothetical protein [Phenylobacterium sp.]
MTSRPAPSPHLNAPTWACALGVSLVVAGILLLIAGADVHRTLGDTDDAMRLVNVRALMDGQGWWDQRVARLQPPIGMDMHWSRLIDGALVGMTTFFELLMERPRAEDATRMIWPLLWVFPAAWAAMSIARRFGGGQAMALCALLLIINPLLFGQWRPGRIDHHDVQIALTLAALAGAVRGDRAGALLAALTSALALAVGLECLPFVGLIGAGLALRFVLAPADGARPAAAYAVALPAALTLLYAVQTAPSRWATPFCDALGANLWGAVMIAGVGLCGVIAWSQNKSLTARLAALGAVGVAAAFAYLAPEPRCLGGPLGAVDPALRAIWLLQVDEMQPLLTTLISQHSDQAAAALVMIVLGVAGWIWLGVRGWSRDFGWMMAGACLIAGLVAALQAGRIANYPFWIAAPLVAAGLAVVSAWWFRGALLPGVALLCLTSQAVLLPALDAAPGWKQPVSAAAADPERCDLDVAYAHLASQPKGLVLAEIDLGPFILADTVHSVVSAPYHRAERGILGANTALASTPQNDEAAVRSLGVDYVVACPARRKNRNHEGLGAASLQMRLDRGEVPAWLEPRSTATEALQIYAVSAAPTAQSINLRVR